ncbi:uncharacterized protein LOC110986671 [Acanthaster planci]|uniref:Uncharacterized protein LOC110986671 n=1 Tax=Acanthaster planci TaxID=133434 RepID=A0A8B7ZFJ8_ACAPL|nr:uncharacterized protein LOC110986671 [Acanthaster planci]
MRLKNKHYLALLLLLITIGLYFLLFGQGDNDGTDDMPWESRRVLRFDLITRDPSRVVSYNYPITNNYTLSNITIDLSKVEPDWKELDHRMVVVTGFNQHLAYIGLGMIASVQAHMPLKKVIVYNLGIHPKIVKSMQQMCNVEVRRFNFDKYPKHLYKTDNKAWRVFALLDILNEYGAFFFVDPHIRFRAPLNLLFPFIIPHKGLIAKPDKKNTTLETTHPSLYHLFGLHIDDFKKHFPNGPAASQDALLVVNSSYLHTKLWSPLIACASKLKCIAPFGAVSNDVVPYGRTHTHRFDFTAVTLLMYRAFMSSWYKDTRLNMMLDKTIDYVEPGGVHDYIWAHYCNPPKSEIDCSVQKNRC